MTKDDASKKCTDSDAVMIEALKEGMKLACEDLAPMGIKPERDGGILPNSQYDAPWLGEKKDLKMMRKAEGQEADGMWNDIAGGVEEFTAMMA